VRLQVLLKLKKLNTFMGFEPTTFQLVTGLLNHHKTFEKIETDITVHHYRIRLRNFSEIKGTVIYFFLKKMPVKNVHWA
jgi:hypothetical protein